MATSEKPRAKSKVKMGHLRAISQFAEWLEEHPDAPLQKRVKVFDRLVDKNAA